MLLAVLRTLVKEKWDIDVLNELNIILLYNTYSP